jgi:hypothetical protein
MLALSATVVQAAPACYQLEPYTDRLEISFLPLSNGHQQLFGTWKSNSYSFPITGTRAGQRLSIFGANYTKRYFGGNVNCALTGQVWGSWAVGCAGGRHGAFRVDDADQSSQFPTRVVLVACEAPVKSRRGGQVGSAGELP